MDTTSIGDAYEGRQRRRIGVSAAVAAGGAAVVAAFGAGIALAPVLDDAPRTDVHASPATSFHTVRDAASEAAALRGRSAAARVLVTAGGWTGLVDPETGIPVSAGIPRLAARDIRYERVR